MLEDIAKEEGEDRELEVEEDWGLSPFMSEVPDFEMTG